jgi:hypothetical protein
MQYMLLIYQPVGTTRTDPEVTGRYMALRAELQESGALVAGDGLQDLDTATTLRVREAETLISDGPFAETKEMLAGYFLVDVDGLDEALAWAAKIPGAETGSIEVRPLMVYDRV